MSLYNDIHLIARDKIINDIKEDHHKKYNDVATQLYIETELVKKIILKKIFQQELKIILKFFEENIFYKNIIVLWKIFVQEKFIKNLCIISGILYFFYDIVQHYDKIRSIIHLVIQ